MSSEEDRGSGGLVPFVGGGTLSRSTSLVRRGLSLFEERKPTEDATIAELRNRANAGEAAAQHDLGVAHLFGHGVEKDEGQAVLWFHRAAEQGHGASQFELGRAYWLGVGVEKDDARAVLWFRGASGQGHAEAQFHLAWAYDCSLGVVKDGALAVLWYTKAAEQGHAEAQFELGIDRAYGFELPQDYVEAYKWLTLATLHAGQVVDRRRRFADSRDAVAEKMSDAEIAEAQKRAKEWTVAFERRKPYGKCLT